MFGSYLDFIAAFGSQMGVTKAHQKMDIVKVAAFLFGPKIPIFSLF